MLTGSWIVASSIMSADVVFMPGKLTVPQVQKLHPEMVSVRPAPLAQDPSMPGAWHPPDGLRIHTVS